VRAGAHNSLGPYSLPVFTEVRGIDFLRTSPFRRSTKFSLAVRGASQRKKGDVVLLLPALPYEGVKFLQ
jgi:hypothetical protein